MMRLIATTISLLLTLQLASQTEFKSIPVKINQYNQAYYRHILKAKETPYSLARYFKVPVEDLLVINKIKRNDNIPIGAPIDIPINLDEVQIGLEKKSPNWVPIIYTVKAKETLYKISTMYFPQKLEILAKRNDITSFSLNRGEQLVVGWWGAPVKQEEKKLNFTQRLKEKIKQKLKRKSDPTEENNSKQEEEQIVDLEMKLDSILSDIIEEELVEIEDDTIAIEEEPIVTEPINYKLGLALWDKGGDDRENLFVMHNSAKPNSYIRLRYPVTGKEITAKVLGPIPRNVYGSDIDILITPAVAIALGALDSRFQIQMDYYK